MFIYPTYKNILLFIGMMASSALFATRLELIIKIKEESGSYIYGATASVFLDNKKVTEVQANKEGALEFNLDFDKVYLIEIDEKKHDKGKLNINTTLPAAMKKFIYNYTTTINLINKKEGFKVVYTQDPTVYVVYKKDKDGFGMVSKYLASYTYEPEKPIVEDKIPVAEPKVAPVNPTIPEPKITPVEPVARDKGKALEDRLLDAKSEQMEFEKQKELEKANEINNMEILAAKKRSFMEEIADSKRTIKLVDFEKSVKRLP